MPIVSFQVTDQFLTEIDVCRGLASRSAWIRANLQGHLPFLGRGPEWYERRVANEAAGVADPDDTPIYLDD